MAVVYIHGFSASPQENEPAVSDIATSLGANLFKARLSGHGKKKSGTDIVPELETECTRRLLLQDAVDAFHAGKLHARKHELRTGINGLEFEFNKLTCRD